MPMAQLMVGVVGAPHGIRSVGCVPGHPMLCACSATLVALMASEGCAVQESVLLPLSGVRFRPFRGGMGSILVPLCRPVPSMPRVRRQAWVWRRGAVALCRRSGPIR